MQERGAGLVSSRPSEPDDADVVSTDLIARARAGDSDACRQLVERSWRILRRHAHGKLPQRMRGFMGTEDLVQSVILRVLRKLDTFEPVGTGAFAAFAKKVLSNRLIDIGRGARSKHPHEPPPEDLSSPIAEPVDDAADTETRDAYLDALDLLTAQQQSAVILRIELGYNYRQIADELAMSSANAARMCYLRGLRHLRRALRAYAAPLPD